MLAVLGPTASGKSGLAERLALARRGELVNADASALYRELEVGVTKPDTAARQRVPHHLLDVAGLETTMTLVDYQKLALAAFDEITQRERLPILVGGSSLYARAVLDGYLPTDVLVSPELRDTVRSMTLEVAGEHLRRVDPAFWQRIDQRNPRRVGRALELALAAGEPIPEARAEPPPDLEILRIVLLPSKEILEKRVRERTESMWEAWREEVLSLEEKALAHWLDLRKPIGYGTMRAYLRGELAKDDALEQIVRATCNLAKKQRTWLQKDTEGPDRHRLVLARDEDWDALPARAVEIADGFLARFQT